MMTFGAHESHDDELAGEHGDGMKMVSTLDDVLAWRSQCKLW